MDETGLFFKLLPNRAYVKNEETKVAHGTKLMKAKDRVTVYVCTNGDGRDRRPFRPIHAGLSMSFHSIALAVVDDRVRSVGCLDSGARAPYSSGRPESALEPTEGCSI